MDTRTAGDAFPVEAGASEADERAFAAWIRPHWSSMANLARRLSPPNEDEDVLQDALSAAWRFRSRYDPERGDVLAWLLSLVVDHARRHRRQWGRRPILSGVPERADEGSERFSERNETLLAAVQSLPARQRLAVELYYFLDLPVEQVARIMNCRVGTVKSTLSAARGKLAQGTDDEGRGR